MALSKKNLKDAGDLATPCAGGVIVPPLHQLARMVRREWGSKVYFGAVPYLDALGGVETAGDFFGLDSAQYLIMYLLSNATTWRGARARQVKACLRLHYEGECVSVDDKGVELK